MNYATNGQESGMYTCIKALGNTCGFAAALLLAPGLYSHTRVRLIHYFSHTCCPLVAPWMTYAMFGVYAAVLFYGTRLAFVGFVNWTISAAAARRFARD